MVFFFKGLYICMGFPGDLVIKNPLAVQETSVWSLGQEDPLEEGTATYSSILVWRISWTGMPGVARNPQDHKELDTTEVTEHARMNIQVHTAIFKTDNQQGPAGQQGKLLSVMWQTGWEAGLGKNEYMYMYGRVHLCCPPETITTLLIGYTPT